MPKNRTERAARREAIRRLLDREAIPSQAELARRLAKAGHLVTQSSLSRDLRELGAGKVNGVYRLVAAGGMESLERPTVAGRESGSGSGSGSGARRLLSLVRSVDGAGDHLVVIRTEVGAAQGVAVAIDRAGLSEVVGTVAGDDTIFVATNGKSARRRLERKLAELRRGPNHG